MYTRTRGVHFVTVNTHAFANKIPILRTAAFRLIPGLLQAAQKTNVSLVIQETIFSIPQ